MRYDRTVKRNQLKKIYKEKMQEDRQVGLNINKYVQQLHQLDKLSPEEKSAESTKNEAKHILEELKTLRNINRFRTDFPTFAVFNAFVKKHNLSEKDLV